MNKLPLVYDNDMKRIKRSNQFSEGLFFDLIAKRKENRLKTKQTLKVIFEETMFFLRRIVRIQKQIKKARKAKRDLLVQAEVAKKLDQYVAFFLAGKIEKIVTVAKKPELVGKKIIWQF
jgi:hypothetical protein